MLPLCIQGELFELGIVDTESVSEEAETRDRSRCHLVGDITIVIIYRKIYIYDLGYITISDNLSEHQKNYLALDRMKAYHKVYYGEMKRRWVVMLGGKCHRCGYDRCIGALDLHHIGQSKDECNHEYMRQSFKKKILAGRIMLLCSNCHRELHYIEQHALMIK